MNEEKRNNARRRTLKTGTIAFGRAAGIDCVVRNLSKTGACLEIDSPLGIPDEFILIIKPDRTSHGCKIIWRQLKRLGVSFVHSIA